jgi:hypothetical protein
MKCTWWLDTRAIRQPSFSEAVSGVADGSKDNQAEEPLSTINRLS